jgi:hypothetical protein
VLVGNGEAEEKSTNSVIVILMEIEPAAQIYVKYYNIKLHASLSSGFTLLPADRQKVIMLYIFRAVVYYTDLLVNQVLHN